MLPGSRHRVQIKMQIRDYTGLIYLFTSLQIECKSPNYLYCSALNSSIGESKHVKFTALRSGDAGP